MPFAFPSESAFTFGGIRTENTTVSKRSSDKRSLPKSPPRWSFGASSKFLPFRNFSNLFDGSFIDDFEISDQASGMAKKLRCCFEVTSLGF
ncbi:MAG: hypothetical protein ABI972_30340, partial [Acidobacteriota bacterium]